MVFNLIFPLMNLLNVLIYFLAVRLIKCYWSHTSEGCCWNGEKKKIEKCCHLARSAQNGDWDFVRLKKSTCSLFCYGRCVAPLLPLEVDGTVRGQLGQKYSVIKTFGHRWNLERESFQILPEVFQAVLWAKLLEMKTTVSSWSHFRSMTLNGTSTSCRHYLINVNIKQTRL